MSTASETAKPKPASADLALVVFGRDDAGKPHAAYFDRARPRSPKKRLT